VSIFLVKASKMAVSIKFHD